MKRKCRHKKSENDDFSLRGDAKPNRLHCPARCELGKRSFDCLLKNEEGRSWNR